jgi:hypothetical protein
MEAREGTAMYSAAAAAVSTPRAVARLDSLAAAASGDLFHNSGTCRGGGQGVLGGGVVCFRTARWCELGGGRKRRGLQWQDRVV